jgi:hypothetical protein
MHNMHFSAACHSLSHSMAWDFYFYQLEFSFIASVVGCEEVGEGMVFKDF